MFKGIELRAHTVGITTGNDSYEEILDVNPSSVIHNLNELTNIIN